MIEVRLYVSPQLASVARASKMTNDTKVRQRVAAVSWIKTARYVCSCQPRNDDRALGSMRRNRNTAPTKRDAASRASLLIVAGVRDWLLPCMQEDDAASAL